MAPQRTMNDTIFTIFIKHCKNKRMSREILNTYAHCSPTDICPNCIAKDAIKRRPKKILHHQEMSEEYPLPGTVDIAVNYV